MSSSDPHPGAVLRCVSGLKALRTAAVVATMAIVPALAGCGEGGFRPLHADLGIGPAVQPQLEAVKVAPIPGRVGQQLRNELMFQTRGASQDTPPLYRLNIAIQESVSRTLVQRTAEAKSEVFNLNGKFALVRIEDNTTILSGDSTARAGYERFDSIYSNVRARRNAENRAAKTMAEDLRARLAAYFAGAA